MKIDIDTRWICLLGDPLRQSYAHHMMNFLFESNQENYFYRLVEVGNDHLKEVMDGMRYMNCAGLCITKPNKVKVLEYLDEIDESVSVMGASNTVVFKDGKYIGYNTDGEGFYRAIQKEVPVQGGHFVFFGLGGAGRACAKLMAERGAGRIVLLDIDAEAVSTTAKEINDRHPNVAVCLNSGDDTSLKEEIRKADLVANMTGLGMYKTADLSPLDPSLMKGSHALFFDATYNPAKTRFLLDAEACGCRIKNGLDMMLELSAVQYELLVGKPTSVEPLKEFAKNMLYM